MDSRTAHIAAVSVPAFTHQASIMEFFRRLVHIHHDFHVTCIIPTIESPPKATISFLEILPSNIDYIFLPPPNLDDLPKDTYVGIKFQVAISRSMPSVCEVLKTLNSSSRLVAVVTDPFANDALNFAKEFNIPSYVYLPYSAMILAMFFHVQKLNETISCEYKDLPEPIRAPGCVPFHGSDLPDHLQDRCGEGHKLFIDHVKRYCLADGLLINSFVEMEEGPIKALQEGVFDNPSVYTVGPVIQNGSNNRPNESECLRWLDNQPPNSVLYISFGSGGTLPQEQVNELALGLELSGKRFIWVFRAPNAISSGLYLSASNEDPLQFLPSGFLERTKEQGLVIPSWAPQIEILSHNSTGGFLSHCGWNSTLESIVHGVPIIAWPLFAEQKLNAVMLTDGLKVALSPKMNENGIVEKEEIAKVINTLFECEEGKEIGKRIKKLKEAAAVATKENGSSARTLFDLGLQWKNNRSQ